MVLQSELVAHWADGKRLAFIGDGDSISVSVAYLQKRGIVEYGPSRITVFDFDERICGAITRFADSERIENLDAQLYNCIDPFPATLAYDDFYTNPPWGASNDGESVKVFMQRGMEATRYEGEGMVVIADDREIPWPQNVLAGAQEYAIASGYFIQRMMSELHSYHLDDAPNLKSCNLMIKARPGTRKEFSSTAVTDSDRLANFYGRDSLPTVRYIRERKRLEYGKAHDDEYSLESWPKMP